MTSSPVDPGDGPSVLNCVSSVVDPYWMVGSSVVVSSDSVDETMLSSVELG